MTDTAQGNNWLKDVADILGESVHTALRKCCDSKAASRAWRGIHDLPGDEWTGVVEMAAAQVVRVLADDGKIALTAKDKRRLHEWDGC